MYNAPALFFGYLFFVPFRKLSVTVMLLCTLARYPPPSESQG